MRLVKYIKVTFIRGILLLIPLFAVVFVLLKTYNFLLRYSSRLTEQLPFTRIGGVGVTVILSLVLLLLVCFLAGVIMQTKSLLHITLWMEQHMLVYIPGYTYIKARSENMLTKEGTFHWKPATVVIDENEVICFVIDESENYCSLFMPSAPMPSSGVVCARKKSMVRYLPISVNEAILIIKQFGKGASGIIEKLNVAELKRGCMNDDEKLLKEKLQS